MGDNQYNKYPHTNEYQNAHYQVKANVSGNNGASQQFSYDVNAYPPSGYESNTHLSSLSNCVKRLQTQLNQYLTKIIDEGSDGSTSNYNLGSGEVLNSHLMEHYSSGGGGGGGGSAPNTASAFQAESPVNNGYSYYSNYPPNYPSPYHHQPPPQGPYAAPDYYNQQYSSFQEPKPKKQKNK